MKPNKQQVEKQEVKTEVKITHAAQFSPNEKGKMPVLRRKHFETGLAGDKLWHDYQIYLVNHTTEKRLAKINKALEVKIAAGDPKKKIESQIAKLQEQLAKL
jgi:hypothetical protein